MLATQSNFIAPMIYSKLDNSSKITIFSHNFSAEFQPNRRLSVGGIFNISSASLSPLNTTGIASSKLGDQRLFVEYRFYDAPGKSVGFAFVPKFPGYSNPTSDELAAEGITTAVLFGDAQVDITTLLTTEFWPSSTIRTRFDTGYTYRTEKFAAEVPYLASMAYVNPRIDLDFRIRGNFSLAGSTADTSLASLRSAFANSKYVYSDNPWVLILQPSAEFWLTPRFALGFNFNYAALGNNSAHFTEFGLNFTFREASTLRKRRGTFKEVDIGTDQENGMFQGEIQGKPESRDATPESADEEF